jgi:polygalacturonase
LLLAMAATNKPTEERIFGPGHFLRPYFVQPVRCRNVLIEGITITNSPMWVMSPCYCTNVTVRNVTVNTTGANSDGCDPDSCTDVLIRDCAFSDGDDCIAIKAGRDVDGRRVNIPSRNIVIQNCNFKAGHGGVTCGSETSGTITNVFAENCVMNSSSLEKALRFKSNAQRGGGIQNVYIRNCLIKTTQVGIHADLQYESVTTGPAAPLVQNIDIRDCAFANFVKPGGIGNNSQAVYLRGQNATNPIAWLNIVNCRFATNASAGNTFQFTTNIIRLNNRGGGV